MQDGTENDVQTEIEHSEEAGGQLPNNKIIQAYSEMEEDNNGLENPYDALSSLEFEFDDYWGAYSDKSNMTRITKGSFYHDQHRRAAAVRKLRRNPALQTIWPIPTFQSEIHTAMLAVRYIAQAVLVDISDCSGQERR